MASYLSGDGIAVGAAGAWWSTFSYLCWSGIRVLQKIAELGLSPESLSQWPAISFQNRVRSWGHSVQTNSHEGCLRSKLQQWISDSSIDNIQSKNWPAQYKCRRNHLHKHKLSIAIRAGKPQCKVISSFLSGKGVRWLCSGNDLRPIRKTPYKKWLFILCRC